MTWILVVFACIAGECKFVSSSIAFWSQPKCNAQLVQVVTELQQVGTAIGVCLNVNVL